MRKLFSFFYNFIFIDQKTKLISHSKAFSVVSYCVFIWSFIYIVRAGSTEIDYMLFFLFALVGVGNKTIKELMRKN